MYTDDQILNCYRKFKSFVFYSKNLNYPYKNIADFETDKCFKEKISDLTNALNSQNFDFFKEFLNKIDILPLIKTLEKPNQTEEINSNKDPCTTETIVTKINYFINMPTELYILDTLWTLLCISATYNDCSFESCYANIPSEGLISSNKNTLLERINFKSLSIYKPYFSNYIKWQKNIISEAEKLKHKHDTTLISLDLKSYFYKSNVDIAKIGKDLEIKNIDFKKHHFLTEVINQIYIQNKSKMEVYAPKLTSSNPLPIGLVSSPYLANYYLLFFDKKIRDKTNFVLGYARYVDDILILLKRNTNENFAKIVDSLFKDEFVKVTDEEFRIKGTDLTIQNSKTRVFNIYKKGSNTIIEKLKKVFFKQVQ